MFEPYVNFSSSLLKAWQSGQRHVREALITAIFSVLIAIVIASVAELGLMPKDFGQTLAGIFGALAGVLGIVVASYQKNAEERVQQAKIANVEEQVREHPDKPQLAWDLARVKLESYLDRNLSQVRSIYWLTLLVMMFGFGLILYGLLQAFDAPNKLSVSIVSAASGVIISFIGGSFLLIYRSILAQSKDYVTVLERINAVGMAVQVIASIPDESAELKHKTTSELAMQLLGLYASAQIPTTKKPKQDG